VDTIITIEDGKIAECGSLASLLETDGYVSRLEGPLSRREDVTEQLGTVASMITPDGTEIPKEADKERGQSLVDIRRKNGDFSVYKYYLDSSGNTAVAFYVVFIASWIIFTEFPGKAAHAYLGALD
jgi:ATP-binding cassette, subfamily C (CFTR/MRP), member 1